MNKVNPTAMRSEMAQRVDTAFSEISRAVGPMLLVFGLTIVGWMLIHGF